MLNSHQHLFKTQHMKRTTPIFLSGLLAIFLFSSGCADMSNTLKGSGIGAAAGAAIGGLIGKATGKTSTGVLVGGAVGATAGAVIGRQMDKQAEELEAALEDANVERVGDGIKVTFDSAILFGVNSSTISEDAKANLRDLASSLEAYPNTNILIVGHTDDTGEADYNQALSEKRAESAALELLEAGVANERVEIVGYGETDPVAQNDSVEGRRENRRVEVAIYASEEYLQELESGN
mgnify:CR=1 FL=1|jgi:outer membrane protein OmpA-like peptidoglycan-associated protein